MGAALAWRWAVRRVVVREPEQSGCLPSARAGSVTLLKVKGRTGVDGWEGWRGRCRVGDRPRPAGAGRAGPCGAARPPTAPGLRRTWMGRWTVPGYPESGAARSRRRRGSGGWCSFASIAVGGGRRPRRGCAVARSPSGRVNRWTWRTRSAGISPESFREREAARCRSDPVSSSALDADAWLMFRSLHQHRQPNIGIQLQNQ